MCNPFLKKSFVNLTGDARHLTLGFVKRMTRFAAGVVAAGLALAAAAPAAAAPALEVGYGPGKSVEPVIIWTAVGVAIISVVGGTFYLLKRQVGAFPANPEWVAPISIIRSRDLPGDTDPHEAAAPGQEDAHGTGHH